METVAFCEFDKHAQKVIKKHWPDIPIHDDVRTLDGKQYRGSVDVVCGGFPCQDLSSAGKQVGFGGERSSLYREMLRVISECMPRYAIFENVTGLLTGESGRWFGQFLYDLASIGYDAEWHCISAGYVGAQHHRDRVWIIAYPSSNGEGIIRDGLSTRNELRNSETEKQGRNIIEHGPNRNTKAQILTNSDLQRCEGFAQVAESLKQQIESMRSDTDKRERFNLSEPALCGANDGVSGSTHRLKQLGNAVVPQIPEAIGRAIMSIEKGSE
jgi:DNA (cytosine-5)-methyltransferase 1